MCVPNAPFAYPGPSVKRTLARCVLDTAEEQNYAENKCGGCHLRQPAIGSRSHLDARESGLQSQESACTGQGLLWSRSAFAGELGHPAAQAAGLYILGLPADSALKLEEEVRHDKFLVMAIGTSDEVSLAKKILQSINRDRSQRDV